MLEAAPFSPSTWKLGWTEVSHQVLFLISRLFPSALPWDLAILLLLGAAQVAEVLAGKYGAHI